MITPPLSSGGVFCLPHIPSFSARRTSTPKLRAPPLPSSYALRYKTPRISGASPARTLLEPVRRSVLFFGANRVRACVQLAGKPDRYVSACETDKARQHAVGLRLALYQALLADDPHLLGSGLGRGADRGVAVLLPRPAGRLAGNRQSRDFLGRPSGAAHHHGHAGAHRPALPEILVRSRRPSGAYRQLRHARYVLRQSVDFFQNDFAGRIATKVMQAAMGTRDTVMKITEVLVYVGVYFAGAVVTFAASDWRLAVPLLLWFIGYLLVMRHFVPLLGVMSKAQADARSMVTGRIVDSYTNIATVKLFAHADREDLYARDGMRHMLDTVYNSMRTTTRMTVALNVLNALLLFSTG
ncbi:MAG: ABC transporter ATP-binding protein, partial [Alphaproteobacteria bacterium]